MNRIAGTRRWFQSNDKWFIVAFTAACLQCAAYEAKAQTGKLNMAQIFVDIFCGTITLLELSIIWAFNTGESMPKCLSACFGRLLVDCVIIVASFTAGRIAYEVSPVECVQKLGGVEWEGTFCTHSAAILF
jgi:hypothetical protein